jgi:putative endonuclease
MVLCGAQQDKPRRGEWCCAVHNRISPEGANGAVRDRQDMNQEHYVYVLYSLKDKQFYIGYTADVIRRFRQHSLGQTHSTSFRRPFELVYYESHFSKKDALRRESYFKSTKGRVTLKQMLRDSLDLLKASEVNPSV